MAEPAPPGRAGRLWLQGRIAAARRGLELLDRKHQLLQRELEKLELAEREPRDRWEAACEEAERWGLRAALLGGQADLSFAASTFAGSTGVEVTWRNNMGVRYPDTVECSFSEPSPAELAAGNAALRPALRAYRSALETAATHAAADEAYRCVVEELQATKRRVRAIERHRLPGLEENLRRLQLHLDELDREERVVTRWARDRRDSSEDDLSRQ